MTNGSLLAVTTFVLVVLLVLAQPHRSSVRLGFWIGMARLLRRIGRWFWAVGEGVEHGFHHTQKVKREINLDLEPQA
jgi:hypothetical protein